MRKFILGLAMAFLLAGFVSNATAESSLSTYLNWKNMGDCPDKSWLSYMELAYTHTGEVDVRASMYSVPSGGDCRENVAFYDLSAEHSFMLGSKIGALAKFTASKGVLFADYGRVSEVDAMGNYPYVASLPAGISRVENALLGLSREVPLFGELDVAISINETPFVNKLMNSVTGTPYYEIESGRVYHVALDRVVNLQKDIEVTAGVAVNFDGGGHDYGNVYLTVAKGMLTCKIEGLWGRTVLASPAGSPMVSDPDMWGGPVGAPQDGGATIGCGIKFL